MAGQEKAPNTKLRTLQPESSRRIILFLAGDHEALDGTKAAHLQGVLHEHKRRTEDRLFYTDGAFYLDFGKADDDPSTVLNAVVTRTSAALFDSELFADLGGAWVAPAGTPPFESLMKEDWQHLTDVTAEAQAIFTADQNNRFAGLLDHFRIDAA